MKRKIIFNLLLIILVFVVQFSFLAHSRHLQPVNLPLFCLVFILVVIDVDLAFFWTIGLGLLMEIYNNQLFGLIIFSLLLTYFFIQLFFKKIFTNKSITTLLSLGILSIIIYNLIYILGKFIIEYITLNEATINLHSSWFVGLVWQTVYQIILLLLGFIIASKYSNKLKSGFLIK